jgi:hypothetical protein
MANALVGASLTRVLTATTSEQGKGFALGDRYVDGAGNEYIYVQYGTGGATANFVVSISAAHAAVMATSTLSLYGERIGVAMATAVANDFGWAMCYGATNVQTELATVNTEMQTTATAGVIDDATTGGTKRLLNITLTTARTGSAGLAPAILTYPTVGTTR